MIYIYKIDITGQPDHDPNTKHCLNGADGKIIICILVLVLNVQLTPNNN